MLATLIGWRRHALIAGVVLVAIAVAMHMLALQRITQLEHELGRRTAQIATLQQAVDSATRREAEARKHAALTEQRMRKNAARLAELRKQIERADSQTECSAIATAIAAIRNDMAKASRAN